MKGMRYPDEFKSEAVRQITERGHSVADVAKNLGVSTKSLYKWRQEVAARGGGKRWRQEVAARGGGAE